MRRAPTLRAPALFSLLLAAAAMLPAAAARAGAWTKPAGGGYAKLGSATFVSDHAFDSRGDRVDTAPFRLQAQTLYFYGEYGLVDGLTLIGYAPYVLSTNAHSSGLSFHTAGFGDLMAGAQVRVFEYGPVVVSTRFELKLPLYEGAPTFQGRQTQLVPGYPRTARYFPAIGDGQVDLTGFVALGATLPWMNGFFTIESGYRLRSGRITDAVVTNASGGAFVLGRRLLLLLNLFTVLTFPSPDERRIFVGKGYWCVGPAFMLFLAEGLALEVGADLVTRGVNTAGGLQTQLGISYAF